MEWWDIQYSPTVRSTAMHNIWLLAVRYRLISRFIFALKNPLKHTPNTHWFEGWQLVCRICRPRRQLFYGNNFLKRLSFHTSVEIKHSIAHIRQKALCTAQCMDVLTRAGTLIVPHPPLNSNHNGLVDVIGECLLWSTYPRLVVVYD